MRKLFFFISFVTIASLLASPAASAQAPAGMLNETQLQQVKQNCREAQADLHALQQRDTVLRINLGRLYDQTLKQTGAFVTRLGVNKIEAPEIKQNYSQFRDHAQNFRDNYDHYATDLDATLAVNCTVKPQSFYDALEKTVGERKTVGNNATDAKQDLANYVAAVAALQAQKYSGKAK